MRKDATLIAWYGFTIFLSSAFLLVLEIVAGRLIAPYVGVSLYTWTSIIGVILAGLSLGNWIGGILADNGGTERTAGITLALGGLFSLGSLLFLGLIAPLVQQSDLSLLSSSFVYVASLFFAPAVLLGVVTPLLTTLALRLDQRAGHIVGRMHALAALGSILGTFLTGYWLIQQFGTRNVILGTAVCLFMLAAPLMRRPPRMAPAVLIVLGVALSALIQARGDFANPCDTESNYFCIRVVDQSGDAPFGTARGLVLDHLLHGTNHDAEPGMLLAPYTHLMDELILDHFGDKSEHGLRFFFGGGGAYTQPRAVMALYPNAKVTVAELDPAVTKTAQEKLFFSPNGIRILHEDARVALHRLAGERFDVIVTDVFHDISVPYHLVTREYLQLVKQRLAPDGIYTLNVVDAFPNPMLVKSMLKTMNEAFRHVHVWMDHLPEQPVRMTYVISASDSKDPPDVLWAKRGFERGWLKVTEPVLASGTALEHLPSLTDDYVPVERLVSSLMFSELGR